MIKLSNFRPLPTIQYLNSIFSCSFTPITTFNHSKSFSTTQTFSKRNYYDILGVSYNATQAQIKVAYYNQARKLHPDINKSNDSHEEFSQINNAYETLSDNTSRIAYDQANQIYNKTNINNNQNKNSLKNQKNFKAEGAYSYQHYRTDNPEEEFYEDQNKEEAEEEGEETDDGDEFNIGPDLRSFINPNKRTKDKAKHNKTSIKLRRTNAPTSRGKDIYIPLSVTFEQAALGSLIDIEIKKKDICDTCNGSRGQSGSKVTNCSTCKGLGIIHLKRRHAHYEYQCQKCHGLGVIIKHPCKTCKGHGISTTKESEKVRLRGEYQNGYQIKIPKKGNIGENFGPYGDIYLKLQIEPSEYYSRNGNDIYSDCPISITEAIFGGQKLIKTLYGDVDISVPTGTQDGDTKIIRDFGIHSKSKSRKGHHYITYKLIIPTDPKIDQTRLYELLRTVETPVDVELAKQEFDKAEEMRQKEAHSHHKRHTNDHDYEDFKQKKPNFGL